MADSPLTWMHVCGTSAAFQLQHRPDGRWAVIVTAAASDGALADATLFDSLDEARGWIREHTDTLAP